MKLLLICIILLTCTGAAQTESPKKGGSNPVIKSLLATPVSVLELGLFRLNQALDKEELSAFDSIKLVSYDADTDSIQVGIFARFTATTEYTAKSVCESAVRDVKEFFSVDPDTGERTPGLSVMMIYFTSVSIPLDQIQMDVSGHLLEKVTSIKITVPMRETSEAIVCRSDLLGTDTFFSRQ